MAKIVVTPAAFEDLERIRAFHGTDRIRAIADIKTIRDAISILRRHPLIGRIVDDARRELVISSGKTGYLALYRYVQRPAHVRILRIRHQRELGYPSR